MLALKKKRRVTPRRLVHSTTVTSVGHDVWLMVCMHLEHSPHAVFRLMMASKTIQDAFFGRKTMPQCGDDNANGLMLSWWWKEFFSKVCAYQSGLKHSNFHKRLLQYHRKGQLNHMEILRAVFSPRCCGCGARSGHRLLRPWGIRICASCLPHHVISNHALEQRYGIALFDIIEAYTRDGGLLLPLDAFLNRFSALQRLILPAGRGITPAADGTAQNAWIFRTSEWRFFGHESFGAHNIRTGALVFLWKKGVERLMGGADVLRCFELTQAMRRRAAQFLSARIRRLGERQLFVRDLNSMLSLVPCTNVLNVNANNNNNTNTERRHSPDHNNNSAIISAEVMTPIAVNVLRAESRAFARRVARMIGPAPHWFPGGPLLSVASSLPSACKKQRLLCSSAARATSPDATVMASIAHNQRYKFLMRWFVLLNGAIRNLCHRGALVTVDGWFPPLPAPRAN